MNKKTISKGKTKNYVQPKLKIAAPSVVVKNVDKAVDKPSPIEKIVSSKEKISNEKVVNTTVKKTVPVMKKIDVSKQKSSSLPKVTVMPTQENVAIKTNVVKKKLVEVNSEHDAYFVYLKNPLEYRRQLLECSRKILFCLKGHQKVFLIRQKKLEEMRKLKVIIRELIYLNKKFNDKLPKYNTGFLEGTPSKDKAKPVSTKVPTVRKPLEVRGEKTEMERLEESLANIEKKLKTLQ